MNIKIYTDTAADLTPQEITELGVNIINMPVTFDDEVEPTESLDEFWDKIEAGKFAKTSQPSPELFRDAFQSAKDGGYAVLMILISDKLSGTFETANFIKEQVGYEHIYIVNSRYATFGEKLLVYHAVKLKNDGFAPNEIVERLEELRSKVSFYGTPETLTYLARGGRISKAAAMLGNLIKLKPIFICNDEGYIVVDAKVLGLERTILKIVEKFFEDKHDPEFPVFAFYSKDDTNTKKLVSKLASKGYAVEEKNIMPVGSTIGTHFGVGAFGLAFVRK